MKSAYNAQWIYNLQVIKLARGWLKHGQIEPNQFATIQEQYKTPLIHPNIAIRLLLFIATVIAVSGVSGLVFLIFSGANDETISIISILLGIVAFVVLERAFISNHHYKSGVTEALMYMACGFIIFGMAMLVNFDVVVVIQVVMLMVFAFTAFRYLDLLLTLAFIITFSWTIFYHCYEAGGILRSIIPFVFMLVFSGFFLLIRKINKGGNWNLWNDNLLVLEACSLLLMYAGGNYLVVRELSIEMMDLDLQPNDDIPFAFLFYFFTVTIPIIILWAGIKFKDKVLVRVGLATIAFSVFTFKFYYSFGHPEITMMIAGIIAIAIAVMLMRYLKDLRNGFTSENIQSSAWANVNAEAFIISQTMGGNREGKIEVEQTGGGGRTGGGGASTSF